MATAWVVLQTVGLFLALAPAGSALTWPSEARHISTRCASNLHSSAEQKRVDCFSFEKSSETSGLYKKFADYAFAKLSTTGWFQEATIPEDLAFNQAPAKGMQNSIVRITSKAMIPAPAYEGLVRYARIALLETVPDDIDSPKQHGEVANAGIQVLNFVFMPCNATTLPVLGIDLVSLPGGRHLLLVDAQPMVDPNPFEKYWEEWHATFVADNANFPWGGDFPEAVQAYVSKYALWTRLQEVEGPVAVIEGELWDAYAAHVDAYVQLLSSCVNSTAIIGSNQQTSYLHYRRNNDPAKPMLNSLYGLEWTNALLDDVLFPQD